MTTGVRSYPQLFLGNSPQRLGSERSAMNGDPVSASGQLCTEHPLSESHFGPESANGPAELIFGTEVEFCGAVWVRGQA
jgi:hypothetical protein